MNTSNTPADVAARLYEEHRAAVLGTCLGMLRSPEEAADATHEVFAKALPMLGQVRHPRAWLQTAARRHCIDILRRRRLAERLGPPEWSAERDQPDPAAVVERRQLAERTLAGLPVRERRVLQHAFLEDAPLGRVAAGMGLSYAATVQLLSRARRRAADLANLPSAMLAPRLAHVARLLPRLANPQTAGALPRGSVAGGAVVLCFSLLCSGAPGRAVAPAQAAAPSTHLVENAAAPSSPGPVPTPTLSTSPPHLSVPPVPAPPLALPLLSNGVASAAAPSCSGGGPTVLWTHTPQPQSDPVFGSTPPQLMLTSETMQVRGSTLLIRIHVVNMSLAVPTGYTSIRWVTNWTTAGTGALGNAYAEYGGGAQPAFYTRPAGPGMPPPYPVPGAVVTGPNGYVEFDIPLVVLGNPPSGTVYKAPTGETDGETAGVTRVIDKGGPDRDFTFGC